MTFPVVFAAEDASEGTESWFGWSDVVILGGLVLCFAYWYFRKGARDDYVPPIKPIQVNGVRQDDSSFVTKMINSGRNVVVFYGSQTGTAEEVAGRLAKDATRYGMKGIALDPEECDMDELTRLSEIENSLAIFCMATYGEGDPTDNAQEFHEYLQRGDADLSGINFSVFGLGNKTYEHYNAMGKYTDKRLAELGAKRVHELGLGDDDGKPFDLKNPLLAPVVINRELHAGGERSCRHIEFDITNSRLRYEAGDHAAVYPTNDSELVQKIGDILGVDLERIITLTNVDEDSSKRNPFPCPCSYRTALSHYVDIVCPPKTHVLKEVAEYCADPEEKEFLHSLTSAKEESRKSYHEWVLNCRRSIIDVLMDMPSCRPPLDHLLELLPRLQARYYSISSSSKADPTRVSVTAVVVKYETKLGRTVKGVATNYLALKVPAGEEKPRVRLAHLCMNPGLILKCQKPKASYVPIFFRKSQLRLPHKTSTPVIMIGPGTGFAPFRGFIQDRSHMKQEGKEVGPMILYFGCRRRDEDFIYEDELNMWKEEGTLSELHLAFSREKDHKVYVQHLLKQNSEQTWKLIHEKGAHIYVCGDARNMARDVLDTFIQMGVDYGAMTKEASTSFFRKMELQKRYQADVWS